MPYPMQAKYQPRKSVSLRNGGSVMNEWKFMNLVDVAPTRLDVSKSSRPSGAEFHVGWSVLDLSAAEFHLDRTCGSRLRRASPSSISSGRIEVGSTGHRRVPRRLGRAGSERRRVPSRPDVWKSPPPSVAELDLVGTYRSRLDRASPSSTSAGACWI
ncbi:uncharacterized protein IUM83_05362 [Phytophthora cinnamomi]|uniref:uncharacterized protein n=1 Tax=Phytophthora cinnamomi TaxID=4785 RepID=UPI003559B092|nr:hypothetical protein IUM83_05362 [Phytophthora cinnamomi]